MLPVRARHDLDGALGEAAVGGLAREHDGVGAVKHGVGDVGALGAGRPGVGDHRLEHLSRDHARLARLPALGDHHLLLAEDLLRGDLHAEVAARHHHAVGGGEDLVELVEALLVLDLGDDLDVLAWRDPREERT